MTQKQTKEMITKQSIAKALLSENRAGTRSGLILAVIGTLLIGPPFLAMAVALWNGLDPLLAKIIFAGILGAVGIVWTLLLWINVCSCLRERRLLRQGEFEILTERLSYKNETYRYRQLREQFHFTHFKEVEVRDHTLYQLASAGDDFYVVIYRKRSPQPKLIYSTKMYEYREE